MKKAVSIVLSILLLTSLVVQFDIVAVKGVSDEKEFVIKSSVRFTALEHAWNFTEEEKTISLFMNNSWQTVNLINSTCTYGNVTTDEDVNGIASLNLPDILAEKSTEYTVFYKAVTEPRNLPDINEHTALNLTAIPSDIEATYCGNSGTWMTNNTELQNLAKTLAGSETNVLVIVENFVSWIWSNIKPKSHEVPLYPNETWSSKEGDCDDQAILLISLCRIVGIPAFLQIGCIYLPNVNNESATAWNGHIESVQNRIGWHGWAMVYIPPWGWLPVDLTYSSQGNTLDAIKTAAVASQNVIQYMNIIQSDYASDARLYRKFLWDNNFYIWTYDEIIPGRGVLPYDFLPDVLMDFLAKYGLAMFLLTGIVVCSAVALLHIRRMRRRTLESL
jgi:hypothetical protein